MIRLNCFFQAAEPEMYKDALRAAAMLADKSRKHEGCVAYDVFMSTTRTDVFMICETWRDEDALNKHSATPEFKRYCKEMTDRGLLKFERCEF